MRVDRLEGVEPVHRSVSDGDDLPWSLEREAHPVASARHGRPVIVRQLDDDESELAVREIRLLGCEPDRRRLERRLAEILADVPSVPVGDDLDFARFVRNLPCQSVTLGNLVVVGAVLPGQRIGNEARRLLPAALALAVQEELGLVAARIARDGNLLALAAVPGPVRQEVHGFAAVVPERAVEVIAVLRERAEVADAEERAAADQAARTRLAEVVNARPDELAPAVPVALHARELEVRNVRPRRRAAVVAVDFRVPSAHG